MSFRADEFWKKNEKGFISSQAYFSQKYGRQILKKTLKTLGFTKKPALDFGCGPGFFVDQLSAAGWDAEGADVAVDASLTKTETPHFKRPIHHASSLPLPISAGFYSQIFLIEVLEHLDEGHLESVLKEVSRLGDPQNCNIVITTPNAERLDDSIFLCPHCGQAFHRWQHVRSFNRSTLCQLMENHGWETIRCEELNWDRPARTIKHFLRKVLFLDEKSKVKPHLFYAGRIRARRRVHQ